MLLEQIEKENKEYNKGNKENDKNKVDPAQLMSRRDRTKQNQIRGEIMKKPGK